MPPFRPSDDTSDLVIRAGNGSRSAVERLFDRHRPRLRRMVWARFDDRLRRRIDPSDVVQETLAEAHRRFSDWLTSQPIRFFPWLRQMAVHRLTELRRQHLDAAKRRVAREQDALPVSDHSLTDFSLRLAAADRNPLEQAVQREQQQQVRTALSQLPPADREILILRQIERLRVDEVADVLQIAPGTVKSRHYRALQRLRDLLNDVSAEGSR